MVRAASRTRSATFGVEALDLRERLLGRLLGGPGLGVDLLEDALELLAGPRVGVLDGALEPAAGALDALVDGAAGALALGVEPAGRLADAVGGVLVDVVDARERLLRGLLGARRQRLRLPLGLGGRRLGGRLGLADGLVVGGRGRRGLLRGRGLGRVGLGVLVAAPRGGEAEREGGRDRGQSGGALW
jgi:hypothetical protein